MTSERGVVLDASALLALPFREPGADRVRDVLRCAVIAAVNWAEVLQVTIRKGGDTGGLRRDLEQRGLSFAPFDETDADVTGEFYPTTRELQLSLGDRACLALAQRLGAVTFTGDRSWANLDIGVEVRRIRNSDDS
ncbi:MAG: PIN domain-containing protein [Dehalococcoidia bacterium]|nr:PIN domain-containing protein [Dehalococcoidia bacterium]